MTEISMATVVPAGPGEGQVPQTTTATPPRDPRLQLRQNSQANVPRTVKVSTVPGTIGITAALPPKEGNTSYGDKLVESLSGISLRIATAVNLEAEQTKVKKSLGVITHQHEKLKNLDQFPAARDLVALIRTSKNDELEYLKNELNAHKDSQLKLAKQAAGLFDDPEARGQSQQSKDLKAIEADACSTKQLIGKITDDVASLKKESTIQTEENSALKRQINELTNEVQTFKRDLLDDIEYLKKEYDHEFDEAYHRIRDLEGNDSRRATDSNRMEKIESQTYQLKKSLPGTVNAIVSMQLKHLENESRPRHGADDTVVERLTQRLGNLEATLSQGKSGSVHQGPKTDSESHDSRYDHLKKVLQDFIDLQAFKDDQQMKAIEDNDVRMGQKLQETVLKINTDIKSQIETAMQQAMDNQVSKQMDKLHKLIGMNESSEMIDQRLQTVETAIASLETRYISINLHSLVKQAVLVIQRMYPPPPVLHNMIEVINSVQVHLSRIQEFANLSDSVGNLAKQLEIMDSKLAHCDEEMRKWDNGPSSEIQDHKKQVQQDLAALKKRLDDLTELRDSLASISRDNQQRHEDTMKKFQNISLENTRMTKEVTELKDHVNQIHNQSQELTATADQLKTSCAEISGLVADADHLKEIQARINDLNLRVSTILDAYKPEDIRLRLFNVEICLGAQEKNLKAIQDKVKATDQETASSPHASITQLEQDMEIIKKQVKKISENSREKRIQNEQQRLHTSLQQLTKEVRQLEQAKATIERQISAQASASEPSLSPSLEDSAQRPASVNLENTPDKRKKRKLTESASGQNCPRDSPVFEDSQQRHSRPKTGGILQQ